MKAFGSMYIIVLDTGDHELYLFVEEPLQTLRVSNSRILRIKNAKLSGYYFYMNLNIWGDFEICISVPLRKNKSILN